MAHRQLWWAVGIPCPQPLHVGTLFPKLLLGTKEALPSSFCVAPWGVGAAPPRHWKEGGGHEARRGAEGGGVKWGWGEGQ